MRKKKLIISVVALIVLLGGLSVSKVHARTTKAYIAQIICAGIDLQKYFMIECKAVKFSIQVKDNRVKSIELFLKPVSIVQNINEYFILKVIGIPQFSTVFVFFNKTTGKVEYLRDYGATDLLGSFPGQ